MSDSRADIGSAPRRHRMSSGSPDPDRDRRRRARDDDKDEADYRRREHRSSRKESPRRRSSHSPSSRTNSRRDTHERRHRERRERTRSPDRDDDDRRRRHAEGHSHRRRHRERGDGDHDNRDRKEKSSRRRRSYSRSRSPPRRPASRGPARSARPLPSQSDMYKTEVAGDSSAPPPEKEKPNFSNTGRLAAESNTVDVNGSTVVLKYHEPPEARKAPAKDAWRLYVFKGQDLLEMVELNERSCWLIGREQLVVDFPLDHPSCSKQHAALQFRYIEKKNEFGDRIGRVKPYLIDLESANGSTVNGDSIPAGRYVEVRDKDVLKFGLSSREYVLMLTQPD